MEEEKTQLRVVIIDDYDMTRSLLRVILRGSQFNIVGEANDGPKGLDLCLRLKPDLVLLDVMMPGLSGLEVLEKIREFDPQPLVLMVTGADDEGVMQEALEKGASGYVVKPFNSASVLQTLNEAKDKFVVREAARINRV